MKEKTLLILGGSFAQLPFIIEAKERGYYTVLVDYLEDNPGIAYADEYYNLSTTDKIGVYNLAKKIEPDIVYSYASDPAAPTVAYVSGKLGLKYSNNVESVEILGDKKKFKEFLRNNNFSVPDFLTFNYNRFSADIFNQLTLPFIIKPTDSSGSKGVSLIRDVAKVEDAVNQASVYSRNKILIAEEYIDTDWKQIHGDVFVENGKIIFSHLGDHHFDIDKESFVPYSTSWPSMFAEEVLDMVTNEIQKVLNILDYKNGPLNVEARVKGEKIYLMELGPRNGGNYVPLITKISTGFDMIDALFNQFERRKNTPPLYLTKPSCYYVLRSYRVGTLNDIIYAPEIEKNIVRKFYYKKKGEQIKPFSAANEAIGIVLLTFNSVEEMILFYDKAENYIKVDVI